LSKPKLLDLFCCAGGAAVGYHRAGFDAYGVELDEDRAKHYPFPVHVGDALTVLRTLIYGGCVTFAHPDGHTEDLYLVNFVAIHASPPCQANTALTKGNRGRGWVDTHIDMIPETRDLLDATSLPYVIENVQGATSMRRDLTLCGEMFGLAVIRHRYFELGGWSMEPPEHIPHRGKVSGWNHGVWQEGPYFAVYGKGGGKGTLAQWQEAMGIDWMHERILLAEAIPPAYTEFVGKGLINAARSVDS
jgi:site-specific DNA-cytosine methylase